MYVQTGIFVVTGVFSIWFVLFLCVFCNVRIIRIYNNIEESDREFIAHKKTSLKNSQFLFHKLALFFSYWFYRIQLYFGKGQNLDTLEQNFQKNFRRGQFCFFVILFPEVVTVFSMVMFSGGL
eukprot:TRINITY_DN1518_c1_g2_i6.p4 TRINITY_DN1518_c1_g2~~TRINITY_DN1518_c1_g2_i6.p4  ORF type:complete len:123 (+),score=6.71 TRINITY_DN1518_c1_g2_i6:499-867(+)